MSLGELFPPHRRLYLAAFLLDFSVALGLTALPFFLFQRLGGGAALSGTVGAVQMALYAGGCLVSAGFVDRVRNGLGTALWGVAGFAALFVLVPWTGSPVVCAVVATVPFLGLSLAWPALQAWLGGEPDPERRARRLTEFNTATAFGFTLSPLLAGPLFDWDYRLPFLALFVGGGFVAGLILSLPPEPAGAREPEAEEPEPRAKMPYSAGLLYASWAATFTANGLITAVRSVFPKRVELLSNESALTLVGDLRPSFLDAVGPATAFSWLAFLLSLTTVALFAVLGRTRFWQGRFAPLAVAQLAAAGAYVWLGHTRSLTGMVACFTVVGANYGVCFFASLYYSLAEEREKHRRAAVNEGVLGAGGFAGGMGLGYAAERLGIPGAFSWTPVFVLGAMVIQAALLRAARSRRVDPVREPGPGRLESEGNRP